MISRATGERHDDLVSKVRRLGFAQRVVLVVGWAALLTMVGLYIVSDGFSGSGGGWFAYAPGTGPYFVVEHAGFGRGFLAPVALVVLWTLTSMWLLGAPTSTRADEQDAGD